VKRGFVVAVGGAAIVIAGLSGCSSGDKKSESSATTTAGATTGGGTASATAAPSGAAGSASGTKVTIDGQEQNLSGGSVVCTTAGGNVNIAIGSGASAIGAVVSEDGSNVQSVGLGSLNGVALGYTAGTGQGEAKAEKSDKTWKITGTATGIDMANPMQPVNKPFEIAVTCP
jgi:lipoprotein LpqH